MLARTSAVPSVLFFREQKRLTEARPTLRFLSPYSPCREPNLRTRYPYNLIENRSFLRLPGESSEMYFFRFFISSQSFCSVPAVGKWDLNPHAAAVRYVLFRLPSPPKSKRSRRADRLPLSYLLFDNSRHDGTNFLCRKLAPNWRTFTALLL